MKKILTVFAVVVSLFFMSVAPAGAATYKYTHSCHNGGLTAKGRVYQIRKHVRQVNVSQTKSWREAIVAGPDRTWTYDGFEFDESTNWAPGPTNSFRYYYYKRFVVAHDVKAIWKWDRKFYPDLHYTCTFRVK